MIAEDQPKCFDDGIVVAVSSRSDGTMLDKTRGVHHPEVVRHREDFCGKNGSIYANTVYQRIVYGDDQPYNTLREVTAADVSRTRPEVQADGLFTKEPGVGLLLPVADCAATVVYDPVQRVVALLHMGRHSSLTDLIERTIQTFVANGSMSKDLIVWMSPHIKQAQYRLEYFEQADTEEWREFVEKRDGGYYLDIAGHNTRSFASCGVPISNIYHAQQDTATNSEYYSHYQGDLSLRFAVLVYLTER